MAVTIKVVSGKPTGAIAMSGGHFGAGTGAKWFVDEVTEAWKMCKDVAALLRKAGITVVEFYDTSSKSKVTNLSAIVTWHNKQNRVLDVSWHLNASSDVEANGCEVLYFDAKKLADDLAQMISKAGGFKNRGGKERKELYFLKHTAKTAVLLETFFVTNKGDVDKYAAKYDDIVFAKAAGLAKAVGVTIERVVQTNNSATTKPSITPSVQVSTIPSEKGEELRFASGTLTKSTQFVLDEFVKQGIVSEERAKKFAAGTMTDVEAIGIIFHAFKQLKEKGVW